MTQPVDFEAMKTKSFTAGWEAAAEALRTEAERWRQLGDIDRWSQLHMSADTLGRLEDRPNRPVKTTS